MTMKVKYPWYVDGIFNSHILHKIWGTDMIFKVFFMTKKLS